MRFFQWLLAGLTIASLLYVISLNPQITQFQWSTADKADPVEVPVYMFIILTFITGYLVGLFYYWLGSISGHIKTSAEIHALKKNIKQLEEQLYADEVEQIKD